MTSTSSTDHTAEVTDLQEHTRQDGETSAQNPANPRDDDHDGAGHIELAHSLEVDVSSLYLIK